MLHERHLIRPTQKQFFRVIPLRCLPQHHSRLSEREKKAVHVAVYEKLCPFCRFVRSTRIPCGEASNYVQRIKLGSTALLALLVGVMYTAILSLEISNDVLGSEPHRIFGHGVLVCAASLVGISGLTIALLGCQGCVLRLWGRPGI